MKTTATTRYEVEPPSSEVTVFKSTDYGEVGITKVIPINTFVKYYEEIWPRQVGFHKLDWNEFEHYKVSSSTVQLPARLGVTIPTIWGQSTGYQTVVAHPSHPYALYSSGQYGSPGLLNAGLPVMYVKRSDGGFVPPPDDVGILVQRSLNEMLPRIRAELSLFNSVFELKDFASLPKTIKLLANLPSFLTGVTQRAALALRSFKGTLRQWFHAGADSYLQANFNILPLLSDIAAIHKALSRIERRINDFITRAGRTQHRHVTYTLLERPSNYYDSSSYHPGYTADGYEMGGLHVMERFTSLAPTVFHAEIEYNYNYTRYQAEHARLFALYDAMGVNLNPATIWNAIPWSFVVDWVIGVSQWLSTQRIAYMDPQINIHRYLWSVKKTRTIIGQRRSSWNKFATDGTVVLTSPTVPMPVVTESSYKRSIQMPTASSIQSSGLSPKEFSLAAALVIARKGKRRSRSSYGTILGFTP